MKLKEAYNNWNENIRPLVVEMYGEDDEVALSQSWNDYTDSLCKENELNGLQYHYAPAFDNEMPDDDFDFVMGEMGVSLRHKSVASRPNSNDWLDGSRHFEITLLRNWEHMSFHYSMGPALVGAPDIKDVIYCVFLDASSVKNFDFEEWANEMGYDEDSRKAERLYNKCKDISDDLDRLFTEDEINDIQELLQDY